MNRTLTYFGSTLVLLSGLCIAASGDGSVSPLTGVYALSPNNVDPLPGTPLDSHFFVNLQGNSARALYEAMKVEPKFDGCWNQPIKQIGGMQCAHDAQRQSYQCNFAINIATQKIEGVPC